MAYAGSGRGLGASIFDVVRQAKQAAVIPVMQTVAPQTQAGQPAPTGEGVKYTSYKGTPVIRYAWDSTPAPQPTPGTTATQPAIAAGYLDTIKSAVAKIPKPVLLGVGALLALRFVFGRR